MKTTKELKIRKNDTVSSCWYKVYDSGIHELIINTNKKWVSYHRYSNDEYAIDLDENNEDGFLLQIPELKDLFMLHHICMHRQEKDQIVFYWIPYKLIH